MKKPSLLFCMSAMLMTGAYAFTAQFKDFEDSDVSGWGGDAVIADGSSTTANGVPGGRTPSANLKVLSIEGSATNTTAFTGMDASTLTQVDMMVKVAAPDDALELPEEDVNSGVQIAVGINADTNLCVYCKTNGSDVGFCKVSDRVLTDGEWVRVSLNFDYVNNCCQVLLDGDLCKSDYGYATATTNATGNGAWYKLVNTAATQASSMKIVGTTAIDDVYTAQNESGINIDSSVTTTGTVDGHVVADVEKSWLRDNNVVAGEFDNYAPDGSGLKIGEKYVYGLDVNDGQKIELKDMQPDPSDSHNMKFVIPGTGGKDGYTFKLEGSTSPTSGYSEIGTANIEGNTATLNIDTFMSGDTVKYFKAVKTAHAP